MIHGSPSPCRRLLHTTVATTALISLSACASQQPAPATAEIQAQRQEIELLKREVDDLRRRYAELAAATASLDAIRGTGAAGAPAPDAAAPAPQVIAVPAMPLPYPDLRGGQVGAQDNRERAASVVGPEAVASPDFASLLTPAGTLIIDPTLEYSFFSSNSLIYRGVEIVPGIQIGLVEASKVERSSVTGSIGGRLGLTPRWEAEVRVPYTYRHDRFEDQGPRQQANVIRTRTLDGSDIGDVDFGLRYQINGGNDGWPVLIAGLKVTAPTGTGPYDVDRDDDGVVQGIATGSGGWIYEGTISAIYPSDPAVLFASIGYAYSPPYDVNKSFGDVRVGEVDLGDSINLSLGMGFAINNNLSFTLGYKHNFVFETETELDGETVTTDSAQIGASMLGFSYRFSDRVSANTSLELGVTDDAPDVRALLRIPVSLQVW